MTSVSRIGTCPRDRNRVDFFARSSPNLLIQNNCFKRPSAYGAGLDQALLESIAGGSTLVAIVFVDLSVGAEGIVLTSITDSQTNGSGTARNDALPALNHMMINLTRLTNHVGTSALSSAR